MRFCGCVCAEVLIVGTYWEYELELYKMELVRLEKCLPSCSRAEAV